MMPGEGRVTRKPCTSDQRWWCKVQGATSQGMDSIECVQPLRERLSPVGVEELKCGNEVNGKQKAHLSKGCPGPGHG